MRTTPARFGSAASPSHFSTPLEAEAAGIRTLYQEVNLCPNLSVAENMFAGRQPKRRGAIDWKPIIKRRAQAALARPRTCRSTSPVARRLSDRRAADGGDRAGAVGRCARADPRRADIEPRRQRSRAALRRTCASLSSRASAILFVTHFLEQTYAISDRITVMRNGEREGEYLAARSAGRISWSRRWSATSG